MKVLDFVQYGGGSEPIIGDVLDVMTANGQGIARSRRGGPAHICWESVGSWQRLFGWCRSKAGMEGKLLTLAFMPFLDDRC